jgi:hypothetical protein
MILFTCSINVTAFGLDSEILFSNCMEKAAFEFSSGAKDNSVNANAFFKCTLPNSFNKDDSEQITNKCHSKLHKKGGRLVFTNSYNHQIRKGSITKYNPKNVVSFIAESKFCFKELMAK